jgi:membrane protein implicated in regulation of membrane protease activity
VKQATEQMSRLVRDELRLARAELAEKGKQGGIGAGMLGGAGVVALYGVAALLVAGGLALALVLPGWLAALLVGVLLMAVAGVLALVGRARVKRGVPPVPSQAINDIKMDVDEVKGRVHR